MSSKIQMPRVQVNLCQKFLFFHQLTHNMTTDFSFNYQFMKMPSSEHSQFMFCTQIVFFVVCFFTSSSSTLSYQGLVRDYNGNENIIFDVTCRTICVHNMFWQCFVPGIFMYWTGKSIDNLLSYCGLVDARIRSISIKNSPFRPHFSSKEILHNITALPFFPI